MKHADVQRKPPRPGRNGGTLRDFASSGNPGGRPAGIVDSRQALYRCLALSVEDLELVRDGKPPRGWPDKAVASAYSLAAGLILSGRTAGSSATIVYDRSEGAVTQKHEWKADDVERVAGALGVDPKALIAQADKLQKALKK